MPELTKPKRQRVTATQLAIRTGDIVKVRLDNGTTKVTQAVSDPWQLGHGDWVVKLRGFSGGYDLSRCKRIKVLPAAAAEVRG